LTSTFEYLCINWKGGNGAYQWIQKLGELEFLLLIELVGSSTTLGRIKGVLHFA